MRYVNKFLLIIALSLVLLLMLMRVGIGFIHVDGLSMENTYHNGQWCLITPIFDDIDYGDIVIVDSEILKVKLIKRVIGLPGDTVEIKNNEFYINGTKINEEYIKEPMKTSDLIVELGENEYFLCGDNRNNSVDSRAEFIGPFKRKEIISRIL